MARRLRDRWRDQAGHDPGRTGASGPDMFTDDQPTSADPRSAAQMRADRLRQTRQSRSAR